MPDLGAIQDAQQTWTGLQDQLPAWLDLLAVIAAGWGLVLWLFGKRFIRVSITLVGLGAGAFVAGQLGRIVGLGPALVWTIGGGLVGGVVAYLAFRIWVALLLGATMAVFVPWGVAAWHGELPPTLATGEQDISQQIEAQVGSALAGATQRLTAAANTDDGSAGSAADESSATWRDHVNNVLSELVASWRNWWSALSGVVRGLIITGAGVGAVGGFILGMIAPTLGAAIVASLTGVFLMATAAGKLIPAYLPGLAERIPSGPRESLILIIIAAAIGAAFQWTILRRSADK